MAIKLTALSYLGLAIETTPGTAVAPTGFLPVRGFKPQDDPTYLPDQGKRGQPVNVYGMYAGVRSSTYEIDGDFYPTSGGNLLAGWLGTDTVTGSATPYTHTFTGATSGPSYTISDNYVAGFRQFAGSKFDKLTFKFSADSGLSYTAHAVGWLSATATAPTSETYSSDPYLQGWQAAVSIGGSSNAKLESMTIDLTRAGSKAAFSAQNSQNPYDVFVGEMECTWQLTFYMEDDTEYTEALSQSSQAVNVTFTQPGTNDELQLISTSVQFTKPTINRGSQMVMVELSGTAIYNSTDKGVFQAVLKNEISSSYTSQAAS